MTSMIDESKMSQIACNIKFILILDNNGKLIYGKYYNCPELDTARAQRDFEKKICQTTQNINVSKDEIEEYFRRFKLGEPILVDIGGTGDIKCDFKGISPVLKNKDEFDQYFISATLQEDKTYDPVEEEKCDTCSGCGFH